MYLNVGEKLYITVGGTTTNGTGGYNGGGTNIQRPYGGGGATHIATMSGVLSSLSNNKDSVIIVGAGGGGEGQSSQVGGSGGGFVGGNGQGDAPGTGATLSGPGTTNSDCCSEMVNATFGKGGQCYWSNEYVGAGGGGYYGGGGGSGSGNNGSGGGGSGYTGHDRLYNTAMYTYNNKQGFINNFSVYLIPVTNKAKNATTDVLYTNIQTAFEDALDGDVIELIGDGTISNELNLTNKEVTLDLHGYTLTTNKPITSNGTLTITDSTNSGNSSIVNNVSSTLITNNKNLTVSNITIKGAEGINNKSTGLLTLTNVTINSTSNGINNTGTLNANNILINASSYAIYDSGAGVSTVKNANLTASTAIYIHSTAKMSFTGTFIVKGTVHVYGTGGQLIINPSNGATLNGELVNRGKTNIYNTALSYTVSANDNYVYVDNYGELTLDTSSVSLHNTHSSSNYYWDANIRNNGTLRTSSVEFNYEHDYKTKDEYFVLNYALWYSSNDVMTGTGSNNLMGVDNSTNNTAEIRNITITLSDANNGYGFYNDKGVLGVSNGSVTITDTTNNQGVHVQNGTVALENVDLSVEGTGENRAAYVLNGSLNLISGTYSAKGNVAYGVQLVNEGTTLILGTQGGTVSETTPFIKANGATTGIGLSQGQGNIYFYDGMIAGTTEYLQEGDIINEMEDNYIRKESTYTEDGVEYKACIPHITFL